MIMIEKHITSQRGKTFYWTNEKATENPTIIFSHGLTADHTLFDKQIDSLSKVYNLITWDYPLHGKSRPYINFTYEHAVNELKSILDAESIEEVILVGQSAGGYISQAFIHTYPNMVKGFVGIGTTPLEKKYYKKSELFWIKHYNTIAKMYPYQYYCSAGSKGITYTKESRDSIYNTLVNLGKQGMLDAATGIYGEFLKWDKIVDIQCPVLLIYGKFDKTGLIQTYNKVWATNKDYNLVVLDSASHNANFDNYTAFNQLLLDFVSNIT